MGNESFFSLSACFLAKKCNNFKKSPPNFLMEKGVLESKVTATRKPEEF
jgi:hypothetical protein